MYRNSHHLISLAVVSSAAGASTSGLAQAISPKDALKAATQKAKEIQAAAGGKSVAKTLPPGDPCTALPQAAVSSGFPGAKAGERSIRLERLLALV